MVYFCTFSTPNFPSTVKMYKSEDTVTFDNTAADTIWNVEKGEIVRDEQYLFFVKMSYAVLYFFIISDLVGQHFCPINILELFRKGSNMLDGFNGGLRVFCCCDSVEICDLTFMYFPPIWSLVKQSGNKQEV